MIEGGFSMLTRMTKLAGVLLLALPMAAAAQDKAASPLSGVTESPADKPLTLNPGTKHADPEIERMLVMLSGSFKAEAAGEAGGRPALRYNAARIAVDGLDNAVYFEVTREDSPLSPFRQGVFHLFRAGKELRLRVLDLRAGMGFGDAVAGLWAAPAAFPAISLAQLDPNLDLIVTPSAAGASAKTAHAFPTVVGGAVDMTSEVELDANRIVLHDVGFDANGREVWGGGGTGRTEFVRQADSWFSLLELADGLVAIGVTGPSEDAPRVVEGGEVAVHYTGWLADGARFDTTRQEGRDAFKLRVPGAVIKGWSDGLKGIGVGERRKLVIPPELGYGERGAGRGVIPPNATLIFEIECVFVDNSNPAPPMPPPLPAGANPHGGGGH
jgi:FKBP-type peptidyl-prolyl cis-trans isomerase FkpA